IYDGETIDARREKIGWSTNNYNAEDWSSVKVKDLNKDNLIATYNEPIRKQESFEPKEIFTTPEGDQVIDFGQNLVGWVLANNINGQSGDSIVLEHAEELDKEGNFYTENLRAANQKNKFILKGEGSESFEPYATWQGFRYVRVK